MNHSIATRLGTQHPFLDRELVPIPGTEELTAKNLGEFIGRVHYSSTNRQ